MVRFKKAFGRLPDPRAENARHDLLDILFIALAAVLCGAEDCSDMAAFGRAKETLLRQFLRLEHGIPSHDTFSRVFRILDPEAFEQAFRRFMAAFAAANGLGFVGVVAVDGKALRGAYERGRSASPIHMVNVWAVEARMALASRKAPGRNEVVGAWEVLEMLSLEGCIVTADAMHCNRGFAKRVLERGADYVLALKQNQGKLFTTVVQRFARAGKRSRAERLERSTHDRREWRRATVIRDSTLAHQENFPGIVALARITSRRRLHGRLSDPPATRYFLLSSYTSAKTLLQTVRSHWRIENQLHWVLDVVLAEDSNRSRKDNGPENLAVLRRLALNVLRSHPDRSSMRQKSKRAGWDDGFLLSLLSQMR
jgi:predicted transposase YbfD/YdcC